MAQNKQTIAVMGDVAIDWLLMRPGGKTARDINLAWAWNTGFAGRMISDGRRRRSSCRAHRRPGRP